MNSFLSSKKSEVSLEIVLDIGSKSVGGAIFEKSGMGKPNILYTAREPIAFQKVLTGESLLTAMLRACELVLVHLEKYGISHLSGVTKSRYRVASVAAIVSSPWHISDTKVLKLTQEKPSVITKLLVQSLIDAEEKEFEAAVGATPKKSNKSPGVREKKIIEMRLNGYPTSNPYGKSARTLELLLFASVATAQTLEKIQSAAHAHFPEAHFEFHTFSLAAFAAIRDTFKDCEQFITVQAGGEVTDITIVKKGVIVETISFPLGHNTLLCLLDTLCIGHPNCTLEGLIALYLEKKGTSEDRNKVERAILQTKASWLELFNGALSNFSAESFLPKSVFLFEDALCAPLFEDFLKAADSGQFTVTAEPFAVTVVDLPFGEIFADYASNSIPDAALSVEASFLAHLVKSDF